jgi:hypothetical protein
MLTGLTAPTEGTARVAARAHSIQSLCCSST